MEYIIFITIFLVMAVLVGIFINRRGFKLKSGFLGRFVNRH